jgi:hypothetical protein
VCSHLYTPVCCLAQQLYGDVERLTDDITNESISSSLSVATLVARLYELGYGIQRGEGSSDLLTWLHRAVDPSVWAVAHINHGPSTLDPHVAGFLRAQCMFRVAAVLLSDWDVCSNDPSSSSSSSSSPPLKNTKSEPQQQVLHHEFIAQLLRSAASWHQGSMKAFLENSQWKTSELSCHAMDSASGNHIFIHMLMPVMFYFS